MKKNLMIFAAAALATTLAIPALAGPGFYTDLKAYASAYYYDFETDSNGSRSEYANGAVFLGGLRFSFF